MDEITRTMPEPFAERGVLDVYLRALRTARRLIYIEDQYFRSTHVSDAIADAVRAWPDLVACTAVQRLHACTRRRGSSMFSLRWHTIC